MVPKSELVSNCPHGNAHCLDGVCVIGFPEGTEFPCPLCRPAADQVKDVDLRIEIKDENNEIRYEGTIYQDGSDSEAIERIAAFFEHYFNMEESEVR